MVEDSVAIVDVLFGMVNDSFGPVNAFKSCQGFFKILSLGVDVANE